MLELLFKAAHVIALIGWLALVFAPTRPAVLIATARLISVLLAASYTLLLIASWSEASALASNYTLEGVGLFFANPALLLLGWVHYLAFDLWVGTWEAEEATKIGLPYGILLLSLLLTFLLGPVGLLSFMLLRAFHSRSHVRA